MPGGRPRLPGTADERTAHRRRRVLQNVRRFRARQYESSASSSTIPSVPDLPDHELVRQYTSWLAQRLPFRLNFGPTYRDAFISRFLFPSLGDQSAERGQIGVGVFLSINLACGSLLASSFFRPDGATAEKRLMSDLFLASALHEFNSYRKHPGYEAYALQTHSTVTRALTRHISTWTTRTVGRQSPSTDCLSLSGVIVAFAVAELILYRSWDRFWKHLQGAAAVIESAGADQVRACSQFRKHFHGFRKLCLPFALMYPQDLFLSHSTWTSIPSSDENDLQSEAINGLVNIAYHISARPSGDRLWFLSDRLSAWRHVVEATDPWDSSTENVDTPSHVVNILVAYCALQITVRNFLLEVDSSSDVARTASMASQLSLWTRRGISCLSRFLGAHNLTVAKLNYLFCLDAAWVASVNQGWGDSMKDCENLADGLQTRGLPLLRDHRKMHTGTTDSVPSVREACVSS